jgi:hypothetical protein
MARVTPTWPLRGKAGLASQGTTGRTRIGCTHQSTTQSESAQATLRRLSESGRFSHCPGSGANRVLLSWADSEPWRSDSESDISERTRRCAAVAMTLCHGIQQRGHPSLRKFICADGICADNLKICADNLKIVCPGSEFPFVFSHPSPSSGAPIRSSLPISFQFPTPPVSPHIGAGVLSDETGSG